jgi:hypothetical protein
MFSRTFRTFADWLAAQSAATPYVRKITRLYAQHPKASLSQLRRHPRKTTKPLSRLKKVHKALLSPRFLSPKERKVQQDAIDVAREMRTSGQPFSVVARRLGVNRAAVARRLEPYLEKRGGRFRLTETDRLPRAMLLYDERGAYTVIVRSRKEASKIGRYHAALKKWRRLRDQRILAPFDRMVVVDENGERHRFLTDPVALGRLFASREVRFESVYRYVS